MEIRQAEERDLPQILKIYNQGIADRIATLESEPKDIAYMQQWLAARQERFFAKVAEEDGQLLGWASIGPYSPRQAYRGVGDLSIYIDRDQRGKGVGQKLLRAVEEQARANEFYKIVIFTFPFNGLGQGLYRKAGYREVGVLQNQGILDGNYVDVMIMEKQL